ncbi:putative RNA-directed DNA polymerase [Tanacetum coccineum]
MTTSAKFLINVVDVSNLGLTVGHPNGTKAKIVKIEDLKLNESVTLFNVLVVPEYNDLKRNMIVGTGDMHGGLYLFDTTSKQFVSNLSTKCYVSKTLWHNIHGHLADQVLQEGLPLYLWFDCTLTVVYLINRLPSSVLVGQSPYSYVYGRNPTPSLLRFYGCLCYDTTLNNHDKFSNRDVKFYETIFPLKIKQKETIIETGVTEDLNHINFFNTSQFYEEQPNPKRPNDEGRMPFNNDGTESNLIDKVDDDSIATFIEENAHPKGNTDSLNNESEGETNHLPYNDKEIDQTDLVDYDDVAEPVRRSSRQTKLPLNLNDYVVDSKVKFELNRVVNYSMLYGDNLCITTTLNKIFEPSNYKEAIKDNNWVEAMNNEIEAFNRNQTWEITDLPKGRRPIGYKWIFKINYKSNREIERYKARLVAKDVNNAFLYGELEEDVYMKIPEGYASKSNENKVCKFKKSLYGLKQAPRKWNEKLVGVLSECGFTQSQNDHSLFVKSSNNVFIALLVYVDDIIISRNDLNEIDMFKTFLSSKFQIKDLGKLKYFLGIEVIDCDNAIFLSQRKYCIELLHEFGMLGCKPTSVPMEPNTVLNFKVNDDDPTLDNITGYQKLVGKLIYLTHTRPDIAYFVHCLSQHMHAPLKSHLQAALNVLRYLKGSPCKGLRYDHSSISSTDEMVAYADSDWAKCPKTRKSIFGYCVFLNGCLISWKSKKQATLSKSSTEAEYRSIASASCEIIWIQNFLKDLKVNICLPVSLHCDNKSAIQLANNPVFHERKQALESRKAAFQNLFAKLKLLTKNKMMQSEPERYRNKDVTAGMRTQIRACLGELKGLVNQANEGSIAIFRKKERIKFANDHADKLGSCKLS